MSRETREILDATLGTASMVVLLLVLIFLPSVLGTN